MSETDSIQTSSTFLRGLENPSDGEAWQRFDRRYRPLILAVAARMGLRAEDAADVAQETLLQFLRDYRRGAYHRERGRLRRWVAGIARHRVLDHLRRRDELAEARGESALQNLEDEDRLGALFEEEFRRRVLEEALARLRRESSLKESTVEAFRRYGLKGLPARQVAAELGISLSAVYMAKHHCALKLRQMAVDVAQIWDEC